MFFSKFTEYRNQIVQAMLSSENRIIDHQKRDSMEMSRHMQKRLDDLEKINLSSLQIVAEKIVELEKEIASVKHILEKKQDSGCTMQKACARVKKNQ